MKSDKTERTKYLESFQKLRRLEESTDSGYCQCITCGAVKHYTEMHGGHFIGREERATEADPDNVWPQCPVCNSHKGGRIALYRLKLIQKIGEARVERLENIFAASHGLQDAIEKLSKEDQLQVIVRKNSSEYEAGRLLLNKQNRELERGKGNYGR